MAFKFTPTLEQRKKVEQLHAFGLTTFQIAAVLEVSEVTIRRHFKKELEQGTAKATALVAQNLFRTATEGRGMTALTAQMFWLKTRARWREVDRLEVTGAEGQPLQIGVVAIPAKVQSVEEWVRLQEERKALSDRNVIDAEGE